MNNLLSYCGLVDAKIKASDIDLHFTCTSILLSSRLQLHETHKDFLKAHVNYKYPCNFTRYLKHFPSELLEFNFIEGLTPLCKAST